VYALCLVCPNFSVVILIQAAHETGHIEVWGYYCGHTVFFGSRGIREENRAESGTVWFGPSLTSLVISILIIMDYLPQVLQELDDELRESYTDVLSEFYSTFESIYKYAVDLNKFVEDIQEGLYIQMTLEAILWDVEGRQLLVIEKSSLIQYLTI